MIKPYLIGVTGGSGSGKTSFIKALRETFSEKQLCIISQDEYYRPIEELYVDENGKTNFDLPYSIDDERFKKDLERLMAGETIVLPEYTFNNPLAKPGVLTFFPAPVIIVEGIFVFHFNTIMDMLDLKIFIHAKENLKVIRRIKRDETERNYPLEEVLYQYEHHVLPSYEKYIGPYKEEANIIINNNSDFKAALEVVNGFIRDKLN